MATHANGRARRERGSISIEEILRGAFDIARAVSVDNLSMPQLARHLDVGVTSIYWYFRRKDDLLDAMTEQALREAEAQGVNGKAVTPFLLERIKQLTEGRSLDTNIALVKNNAVLGAELAVELAK